MALSQMSTTKNQPEKTLVQINDSDVVLLTFDEEGYQQAKSLLTEASLDLRDLSDTGKERLRNFVKQYQKKNLQA